MADIEILDEMNIRGGGIRFFLNNGHWIDQRKTPGRSEHRCVVYKPGKKPGHVTEVTRGSTVRETLKNLRKQKMARGT